MFFVIVGETLIRMVLKVREYGLIKGLKAGMASALIPIL